MLALKKVFFGELYREERISKFAKSAKIELIDLSRQSFYNRKNRSILINKEFDFERPILTTEKDAARIGENFNEKNVWYLKMGVKLNTNVSKLISEKLQKKNV